MMRQPARTGANTAGVEHRAVAADDESCAADSRQTSPTTPGFSVFQTRTINNNTAHAREKCRPARRRASRLLSHTPLFPEDYSDVMRRIDPAPLPATTGLLRRAPPTRPPPPLRLPSNRQRPTRERSNSAVGPLHARRGTPRSRAVTGGGHDLAGVSRPLRRRHSNNNGCHHQRAEAPVTLRRPGGSSRASCDLISSEE